MITQIIIMDGWKVIEQYTFMIPLTKDDVVLYKDMEYKVDSILLDLDQSLYQILLKS